MVLLILWIFVLIIWIGNLILRTRPSMKNTAGNGLHIFIAVLFIILAIVNIIGKAISLNNDVSSEATVKTSSIEEQTYNGEKLSIIEDSY